MFNMLRAAATGVECGLCGAGMADASTRKIIPERTGESEEKGREMHLVAEIICVEGVV